MFLFPWLDWGDDISDFEKIDFWAHGRFWGVPSPWEGWFFALATLASVGRKISKSVVWKKFLNFINSKLWRNIFWACWDDMVAQKSHASTKMSKNYWTYVSFPLLTELRDIARRALRARVIHVIRRFESDACIFCWRKFITGCCSKGYGGEHLEISITWPTVWSI